MDTSNKKIAKNSLYLYIRTAITMVIALFTSRIVLNQLGVSDYGVYSVICGVVAMLTSLSATLSGATQRYITFSIGKKDLLFLKKVFTASIKIHFYLACAVLIIAETIGVWFVNNKMNLPEGRLFAANVVFQFSILSFILNIIILPFTSAVIAYEKFSFYATIDIFRSIIRLSLVSCLNIFSYDALILYVIIEFLIAFLYGFSYVAYCRIRLPECSFTNQNDSQLFKELVGFTGWNFFGTASSVVYSQGSNLCLNVFWGVILNAAMGVTNQVQHAVNTFISNFTLAVNPQITKSYASQNYERTNKLIFLGSKISSSLVLVLAYPLIVNIHYVLGLWLVEVPEYTELFVCAALLCSFFNTFNNPFNCLIFATGNIRSYQIMCCLVNVLSIIILYIGFRLNIHPIIIFILTILQTIIKLSYMILLAKRAIQFPISRFLFKIFFPSLLLVCLIVFTKIAKANISYSENFASFMIESIVYVMIMAVSLYFIILNHEDRQTMQRLFLHKN